MISAYFLGLTIVLSILKLTVATELSWLAVLAPLGGYILVSTIVFHILIAHILDKTK